MTSLAAAIASDSRGPCSLYLITDSRITWVNPGERWDAGRKTFYSPVSGDVFGYCGDAYFVPIVLGQALNLGTLGTIDLPLLSSTQRHERFLRLVESAIAKVETKHLSSLSLFHGAREGELMNSRFRLWRSEYNARSGEWTDEELDLAYGASYLAHVDGTGAAHVQRVADKLEKTPAAGTSRAAVHAFCKALHEGADPYSGGPPQLVGIWRKGPARQFGFCWHGKAFIAGMEVPRTANHSTVDWFNHLFERCDGRTGRKLKVATGHRNSFKPTGS